MFAKDQIKAWVLDARPSRLSPRPLLPEGDALVPMEPLGIELPLPKVYAGARMD